MFSQPFMIIFFAVLAAFIIFFGFKMINNTVNTNQKVEFEKFILDLNKEVSSVYSLDYGSSSKLDNFAIPSNIKIICFVDRDKSLDYGKLDIAIKDLVKKTDEKNMFFVSKNNEIIEPRDIDKVKPKENPLCENVMDGKLDLVLVNSGSFVQIEKII